MRWTASTAEDTEAIGAVLARTRPRDRELQIIYLSGDLGAGKTTLTRGFLHACGVEGTVRSPTYTLVEPYPIPPTIYLHMDLYRLREPSELENLGVRDWAAAGYVWLVEWPERGADRLPAPDLSVVLTAAENEHLIDVRAGSDLGVQWLALLTAVVNARPQS